MLWLCIKFPFLPLEVVMASNPEPNNNLQPFALLQPLAHAAHGEPASVQPTNAVRAGQVFICNRQAQTAGVRQGMTLATALSLCGKLESVERQPALEQERIENLADIAYGFTSHVSYCGPDQILLEISASLRLFTNTTNLLTQLRTVFSDLGHNCDFSIAHTPLAAQWLLKANINLATHELIRCKTSKDHSNELFSELVQRTLRKLPLNLELWDANMTERLLASGLRTIGAIADLPKAPLGRRLGHLLLLDLARAFGTQPDPRKALRPSEEFNTVVNFLSDLTQTSGLVFPIRRLLRDLDVWLTARQLLTESIKWRLRHERHGEICITVSVAEPTADPKRWFTLTQLQLERSELMPEISSLRLHVDKLSAVTKDERDLLQKAGSEPLMSPPELLDLFRARLGQGALQQLSIGNDHLPEQHNELSGLSNRKHPVSHTIQGAKRTLPTAASVFQRPTWLLSKPRPVSPQQFTFIRGPERIEIGWWLQTRSPVKRLLEGDGDKSLSKRSSSSQDDVTQQERSDDARTAVSSGNDSHHVSLSGSQYSPHIGPELMRNIANTARRDYYVALDRNGGLCWLFTQPSKRGAGWYLHGYFS